MCTENVYFMSMTNTDHVQDVEIKSPVMFTMRSCFLYIINRIDIPKMTMNEEIT